MDTGIFALKNLTDRLVATGWLDAKERGRGGYVDNRRVEEALKSYQAHHGLPVCGVVDGATERHLCACRSCGRPDVMHMDATLQKWPTDSITWTVTNNPPALALDAVEAALTLATQSWAAVCGVKIAKAASAQAAQVEVAFMGMDGPGGTLGWSEMPDGSGARRNQRFDADERWVVSATPVPGQVDLVRVMAHEWGHILGIGHLGPGTLMAPAYDSHIRAPQAGDIIEAQARYGPGPVVTVDPGSTNPAVPAAPVLTKRQITINVNRVVLTVEGDKVTAIDLPDFHVAGN